MAFPTEIDFAIISIGDGESPEVFTVLCGIEDVGINKTSNTSDRFKKDCAKPGKPGVRTTKSSGNQLDITGSGVTNATQVPTLDAALGVVQNYKVALYAEDGTDGGDLLGTYSGAFRLTATNISTSQNGDSSGEITLANHGAWAYVAAS